MSNVLKFGIIAVVSLVAFFIIAGALLVTNVDPNAYKTEIAQLVEKQTGRSLTFDGDIEFHFFPWLGLEVGPIALGNAPGFTPDEMIRINKAKANIEIMPLLSGNVSIGTVVLDGFNLQLAVNKQGVTNWDDLAAQKQPAQSKEESAAGSSPQTGKGGHLNSLAIMGVEITNANVTYNDQKGGTQASLHNLNLLIGEIGDRLPTPIELTFDLKMAQPKIETSPKLVGIAMFDKTAGTFEISKLILDILGMKISGIFAAKSSKDTLAYSGELTLAQTNLKHLFEQLSMTPPTTTDPKALEQFSADIKINGTPDRASLEKLTVKLDDTTLSGTGSVRNFRAPAINVTLNVDTIDLDRYMPPASKDASQPATSQPTTASKAPAEEPDLSGLRQLNLIAQLTIGKLKAMNLRVSEILCKLIAHKGIIKIDPFSAKLYEGVVTAHSTLDVNHSMTRWTETAELHGVKIGPLLTDLIGKDRLLGSTHATYALKGSGLTPVNIKRTITGNASFSFQDGAINGINIAQMLRNAWNTLKGKSTTNAPERTDFAELSGSAVIKQGHVTNDDLKMQSPLLRINGAGWANLPKNTLDYLATVSVVGTLKGQDGETLDELRGLDLPIYAKGNLDTPSIGLDTKAFAQALFKGKTKNIERSVQSILGGKKPQAGEKKKPGNPLKGLFQ